jgi:hypothetical protein
VQFTHNPNFWFSDSIKVGTCNTTSFGPIAQATDENQSGLAGWYEYNQTTPCPMRVWLQVHKVVAGTIRRRFLIVWATPGIAPDTWRVVALTDKVAVTQAVETFNTLWVGVPPNSFVSATSGHPCIRAYILPEDLTDPTVTPMFIGNITTQSQLEQMEAAYNVQANTDLRSAQMNFTNLSNVAVCPTLSSCPTASIPGRDRLDAEDAGPRFVRTSFTPAGVETNTESNPTTAEMMNNPPQTNRGGKDGLVRIYVSGF